MIEPVTRFRALAACALLVACGGEGEPLQVVTGHVDLATWPGASEVRAIARERVLAASGVDADGSFVLALPPADGIRLQVVDVARSRAAWIARDHDPVPAKMRVCTPAAAFETGALRADPRFCTPPRSCSEARELHAACLEEARILCADMAASVATCHIEHASSCAAARETYDACLASQPADACTEEALAADTCGGHPGCDQAEVEYWSACREPCADLLRLVDRRCPGCGEIPDLLIAGTLLPASFGCEGAP